MAAKGVLRDGEAVGQEDEAEEGGERCEAFHGRATVEPAWLPSAARVTPLAGFYFPV